MLKGEIKCSDIGKLIIKYINFDLNKKDTLRVAIHLRNCPKCMEKYTLTLKRKNELKKIFIEIEKKLRMQNEISEYMDNECEEESRFIIEAMLTCDNDYKKEFEDNLKLKNLLRQASNGIIENKKIKTAQKIIAKRRLEKYETEKFIYKTIPLFQHLRRAFAKYV